MQVDQLTIRRFFAMFRRCDYLKTDYLRAVD
jgi:hypothetical protein